MMAAAESSSADELLYDLTDYLIRAGVEPSRLALAALATDQGIDDEAVTAVLAAFDAEGAPHGRAADAGP